MTLHDLRLTRRNFLGAAGALSAAAFLAACGDSGGGSAATSQLDIYSWANHFAQDNLTAITASSGITPKITTYDSNDTLSEDPALRVGLGERRRRALGRRQGLEHHRPVRDPRGR